MCPRPVPGKERRLKKICLGNKFRLFNKLFMSWKNWANRSGGLLRDRVVLPSGFSVPCRVPQRAGTKQR